MLVCRVCDHTLNFARVARNTDQARDLHRTLIADVQPSIGCSSRMKERSRDHQYELQSTHTSVSGEWRRRRVETEMAMAMAMAMAMEMEIVCMLVREGEAPSLSA